MWMVGYTGRRLPSGGVEVLNMKGEVIATTGKAYAIAPTLLRPETDQLLRRLNGIPAPDCYVHDFVDCSEGTTDPQADYCGRRP